MGRYELNQGREDGREPLSAWLARTCRRLTGEASYQTEDVAGSAAANMNAGALPPPPGDAAE